MAAVGRKLSLLERIYKLRRAQRRIPGDADLADVRVELEREVGDTVSMRTAAKFLGVSHMALARWIKSGDLPKVFTPKGHAEISVPALLDLYEAVSETRRLGDRRLHVLEPIMRAARERAAELSVPGRGAQSGSGHEAAELRGLVYHQAVARRLDRDMVAEAWYRLYKWRKLGQIDPLYGAQWQAILERGSLAEIREAMTEESQAGSDLRQNSPFVGMLSEPERRKLLNVT